MPVIKSKTYLNVPKIQSSGSFVNIVDIWYVQHERGSVDEIQQNPKTYRHETDTEWIRTGWTAIKWK